MRQQLLAIATLAASVALAGCMRSQMRDSGAMKDSAAAPSFTTVAVRFVATPEPEPFNNPDATGEDNLGAANAAYGGFAHTTTEDGNAPTPNTYHVALWGEGFQGADVTYGAVPMAPGTYNFAFFDRQQRSGMQGWLDVHATGSDILEVLYRWKSSIPQQARELAYELELTGATHGNDPAVFETFTHQLAAFDRLEQRINAAIATELQARHTRQQQIRDFMENVEVLLIPGTETPFAGTTEPAFAEADLDEIRTGDNGMTKILLVADHQSAVWKLHRVNELYDDLMRCKEVFREQVDRLERRKGLFLLTDHLHHYDKRFVENEIHLQNALSALSDLDDELNALRQRRTALAFVTGLFSPQDTFRALDQEESNLRRELAVQQAEQRRLSLLLDGVEESSVRRVVLERNNQRVLASLEAVNRQLEDLNAARSALATMTDSTDVLHRQGDTRLLTATFVGEDLPFAVRTAVENESLMTVRLQNDDRLSIPGPTGLTAGSEQGQFGGTPGFEGTSEVEQPVPTAVRASDVATEDFNRDAGDSPTTTAGTKPPAPSAPNQHTGSEPVESTMHPSDTQTGSTANQGTENEQSENPTAHDEMSQDQGSSDGDTSSAPSPAGIDDGAGSQAESHSGYGGDTSSDAYDNVEEGSSSPTPSESDVPAEADSPDSDPTDQNPFDTPQPSDETDPSAYRSEAEPCFDGIEEWQANDTDPAYLAGFDEPADLAASTHAAGSTAGQTAHENNCPLWVKLLVPPCWFAKSTDRKTHGSAVQSMATQHEQPAKLAVLDDQQPYHNDKDKSKPCPFLIRLLVPPCWFNN